jgi:pyruvate/2-oxoglutarate dehydrogenase complex dihydrolipoamide dehydrogenase (E3) component
MAEREFDAIVLGAGPVGEVCAGRIADGGLDVAIVEGHLIGGECSYYACMPSKALLRPSELLAEARRVPGTAEAVTGELDAATALSRRDEVIHDLDDSGQLPWLDEKGITLVRGQGVLDGERNVRVGDETLKARKAVVIATGTAAAMPPIDGLTEIDPWSNREATTAKEPPSSLVVLGGGPVGSELAQAWATLGVDSVALLEGEQRLLPSEEPFAGNQVAESLREHGVDVRLGVRASSVAASGDGVEVTLDDGAKLNGEQLLVAVGRTPRTSDIGLDTLGLKAGDWLEVDDQLRVGGLDWLYAIGDVNHRALLTHMGKYQGRVAGDVILGKDIVLGAGAADGRGSPRVTFTDPQVAAVGHTLASAAEAGITARAVDVDTSGTAGASFIGKDRPGTSRLVIDEDRGVITGATFVGFEIGEWLHAATIAVVGELPLERLRHAVPAFPTRSEVWLKLLEEAGL